MHRPITDSGRPGGGASWRRRAVAFGRSRAGSVTATCVGLSVVGLLVGRAGPQNAWLAVTRSACVLPLVLALELGFIALDACSLRMLYGADRFKLSTSDIVRSTLIAYAVAGLVPAGRPVGEAVRGAAFARSTSGARAGAAAVKQQSLGMLVQGAVSVACVIAAIGLQAQRVVTLMIAGNAVITSGLGLAVYVAVRRPVAGKWLGRLAPRSELGPAFHAIVREEGVPWQAVAFLVAARAAQLAQVAILLASLGHAFHLGRALTADGCYLTGATLGDLLPSNLGATETNFQVAAPSLGLRLGDALALPLTLHVGQLLLIAVGSLVPLVWRPRAPRG